MEDSPKISCPVPSSTDEPSEELCDIRENLKIEKLDKAIPSCKDVIVEDGTKDCKLGEDCINEAKEDSSSQAVANASAQDNEDCSEEEEDGEYEAEDVDEDEDTESGEDWTSDGSEEGDPDAEIHVVKVIVEKLRTTIGDKTLMVKYPRNFRSHMQNGHVVLQNEDFIAHIEIGMEKRKKKYNSVFEHMVVLKKMDCSLFSSKAVRGSDKIKYVQTEDVWDTHRSVESMNRAKYDFVERISDGEGAPLYEQMCANISQFLEYQQKNENKHHSHIEAIGKLNVFELTGDSGSYWGRCKPALKRARVHKEDTTSKRKKD